MPLDNSFFVGTAGGLASPTILAKARQTTAGGTYMAKLGDYMFSLDTAAFQSLQRDTAFRWQGIKRIGRASAQQFTGLDDDTIELSGVIVPHFRGGMSQLALMRDAAARGVPLPLIYAFETVGQYCGLWCIRSIKEGRTELTREGLPKRIEFSMSLVAYGEDAGTSTGRLTSIITGILGSSIPASLQLPLTQSASSIASLPAITLVSPTADVNAAAASLSAAGDAAMNVVGTAKANVQAALASTNAAALAATASSAIQSAKSLISAANTAVDTWREVRTTIEVIKNSPGSVRDAARALRTLSQTGQTLASVAGGGVASSYAAASSHGHTAGVNDTDRLTAAATLGNVSRSANTMLSGFISAMDQASSLMGKINV